MLKESSTKLSFTYIPRDAGVTCEPDEARTKHIPANKLYEALKQAKEKNIIFSLTYNGALIAEGMVDDNVYAFGEPNPNYNKYMLQFVLNQKTRDYLEDKGYITEEQIFEVTEGRSFTYATEVERRILQRWEKEDR